MIWSRGVKSIGLCNQLKVLLVLHMEFYYKIIVVEVSIFCIWILYVTTTNVIAFIFRSFAFFRL